MRKIIKAIKRSHWEVVRQTSSHLRLENRYTGQRTTIGLNANGNAQKNIIKQLGLAI